MARLRRILTTHNVGRVRNLIHKESNRTEICSSAYTGNTNSDIRDADREDRDDGSESSQRCGL